MSIGPFIPPVYANATSISPLTSSITGTGTVFMTTYSQVSSILSQALGTKDLLNNLKYTLDNVTGQLTTLQYQINNPHFIKELLPNATTQDLMEEVMRRGWVNCVKEYKKAGNQLP